MYLTAVWFVLLIASAASSHLGRVGKIPVPETGQIALFSEQNSHNTSWWNLRRPVRNAKFGYSCGATLQIHGRDKIHSMLELRAINKHLSEGGRIFWKDYPSYYKTSWNSLTTMMKNLFFGDLCAVAWNQETRRWYTCCKLTVDGLTRVVAFCGDNIAMDLPIPCRSPSSGEEYPASNEELLHQLPLFSALHVFHGDAANTGSWKCPTMIYDVNVGSSTEPSGLLNEDSQDRIVAIPEVEGQVKISNTEKDFQFLTYRYSSGDSNMTYTFPKLSSGTYVVTLGFAEVLQVFCENGKRVFSVLADGSHIFDDLDVYKETGHCFKALYKDFIVERNDDTSPFTLKLVRGPAGDPFISLIKIERLDNIEQAPLTAIIPPVEPPSTEQPSTEQPSTEKPSTSGNHGIRRRRRLENRRRRRANRRRRRANRRKRRRANRHKNLRAIRLGHSFVARQFEEEFFVVDNNPADAWNGNLCGETASGVTHVCLQICWFVPNMHFTYARLELLVH